MLIMLPMNLVLEAGVNYFHSEIILSVFLRLLISLIEIAAVIIPPQINPNAKAKIIIDSIETPQSNNL